MEPTEIDEFRKQVEEGGESGLTYVSLAISILAVLVAMVTVLGHRTHTEAVLQQSRASDQWNLYQAKKIRQNEYLIASDMLTLQADASSAAVQQKLNDYKAHSKKWDADLTEEQDKALEFEADVTKAEQQAGRYDLGEALLEIAVVLSSITLLTRQRAFFIGGIVLGVAGALIAASALLLH
ncbi:MAG TPA: DUF4337 domain-containing protein [Acidobacteriaceae bacterium]|nr:DUF4337 domain-containing protein [Acidobacteriaceae bacterium]